MEQNTAKSAPEPIQIMITVLEDGKIETKSNIADQYKILGLMDVAKAAVLHNIMNPNHSTFTDEEVDAMQEKESKMKVVDDSIDAE